MVKHGWDDAGSAPSRPGSWVRRRLHSCPSGPESKREPRPLAQNPRPSSGPWGRGPSQALGALWRVPADQRELWPMWMGLFPVRPGPADCPPLAQGGLADRRASCSSLQPPGGSGRQSGRRCVSWAGHERGRPPSPGHASQVRHGLVLRGQEARRALHHRQPGPHLPARAPTGRDGRCPGDRKSVV